MRCDLHCPQPEGSATAVVVLAVAALVAVSAAAAFIESVAVVVLAVMGALAVAGLVTFLLILRRHGGTLYAPVTRREIKAAAASRALPASQPRAIGARPKVIPGVVVAPGERIGT